MAGFETVRLLGIVNEFAVKNPLHFLKTLDRIGDYPTAQLSSALVKEYNEKNEDGTLAI
jgi:hypothetical protein